MIAVVSDTLDKALMQPSPKPKLEADWKTRLQKYCVRQRKLQKGCVRHRLLRETKEITRMLRETKEITKKLHETEREEKFSLK
jgi:hypothetical protein